MWKITGRSSAIGADRSSDPNVGGFGVQRWQ